MAPGSLPAPGTEFGPCAEACAHRDCNVTRADAAKLCNVCTKPIGYNTLFFQEDGWKKLTHARCEPLSPSFASNALGAS